MNQVLQEDAINKIEIGDKYKVTSQDLEKKVLEDNFLGTNVQFV